MRREEGMTLVELMVSLSIILIIMAVATAAYLKMLRSYKTQSKISQSYMANLTGLELLRYDIQMGGYGIPADINQYTYSEAVDPGAGVLPYSPASLNDSPATSPRPFATLSNGGRNGSDVLTIRSSVANIGDSTTKKWSLILPGTSTVKVWNDTTIDFVNGDRLIVTDDTGKLLPVGPGGGATFTTYTYGGVAPIAAPLTSMYLMYGLSAANIRMPFNRVDYYLGTVTTPNSCAPNTYTLYRSVLDQTDGSQSPTPLIDCVYDFQVAFGLDTDADGAVDSRGWVDNLAGMSAATMRTQVREVRIFILYHEGVGDVSKAADFRFSGILNLGDQEIAGSLDAAYFGSPPANTFQTLSSAALTSASLSTFDPATLNAQYPQFRWKVLQLAVKPMNLK